MLKSVFGFDPEELHFPVPRTSILATLPKKLCSFEIDVDVE